ncbi:hypothetical protein JL107_15020 [Nakamurella flavida]|uniref:Uncharacterized protein n=1 Tax=Nakamurella flavida TaxID=363630 RepID=A0A938YQU1_9ACTN|nr:hypothetical protein [Nakamurella flavida]MBM9477762.1 hypothetical protein [Nakamurella flavida]MDP9779314.1 hypothetical protein [Nakamurella flavida]
MPRPTLDPRPHRTSARTPRSVASTAVPASRGWRIVRTGIFAVTAAQLAALGHLAGGGPAPDRALLLLAVAAAAIGLHPLTRRRLGLPVLLAATTVAQLLFHVLFMLGAHPAGTSRMAGAMSAESMSADSMTAGTMSGAASSAPMVAFHVLAAAATALLLARGETALFRLFAAWRRTVLRAVGRPAVRVPLRWSPAPARDVAVLIGARLAAVRVVRGPPGVVPAR